MNEFNIVMMYTSVGTSEDAKNLAEKLLTSKLAVCVNVMVPHTAFYYEGPQFKEVSEIGMIIKIPEERYHFAYEAIRNWHPYAVPAILSWPAEANPAYGLWAHHQTSVQF